MSIKIGELTLRTLKLNDVLRRARAETEGGVTGGEYPAECSACCTAGFDISALDTVVALEQMFTLPAHDLQGVLHRLGVAIEAENQARVELFGEDGPPPDIPLDYDRLDDLCDALMVVPCPFLDPDTKTCLLGHHAPEPCQYRSRRWVDNEDPSYTLDAHCDHTPEDDPVIEVPLKAIQFVNDRLKIVAAAQLGIEATDRFPIARAISLAMKKR